MNDFETITGGDMRFGPLGAGDDLTVVLHCDSVRLQAEGCDHAG